MPEADAVARTSARLQDALAGEALTRVDLRWPGLSTAALTGRIVVEVREYGKHILIRLEGGWTLRAHLRMEGRWRVEPTGSPAAVRAVRSPSARAILANQRWTAIGFDLGMLDLVRTAQEATLLGHLGQSVLDPDFDSAAAASRLAAHPDTIGAALLDQTTLAGLGTIWVSESLFAQRLHPWTPAAQLSLDTLTDLVERARALIIARMRLDVVSTADGRRRGETAYVHSRAGRPCRRCGTPVRIASIGPPTRVRGLNYCPTCQGGLAPGDDGRPQAPLGARPSRRSGRDGPHLR